MCFTHLQNMRNVRNSKKCILNITLVEKNIVAYILYYHGPISVCTISSLCLSISTALKIARYKRDTDHHLQDSESRRYNDNKKWYSDIILLIYDNHFINEIYTTFINIYANSIA